MSTEFPGLVPSSRTFNPGNYPTKSFIAINGVEHRLLYGSVRTQMTLNLSYDNIPDADAAAFMAHFDAMAGTFLGFYLLTENTEAKGGYAGAAVFPMNANGGAWRYDSPPTLTSIRPGISSVSVTLRGFH
jgi:hypothetical protein